MSETTELRFRDAETEAQFAAMSRIHARGWRKSYIDAVPADYMTEVITDDHWIPMFRADYESGNGRRGLMLLRGDKPVACATYGPARIGAQAHAGAICKFNSAAYEGWGEVISFYTDPDETGLGYGAVLMREVLSRLKAAGFSRCYVLVLKENEGARRFYAREGFRWDGTHEDIPFPHDTICVDLRYTRAL
ncbi:MAG TPA: GNAT family N-acetyltransferase [Oscillospiraceae bacterium]|nr:GNAT family N-acetyltransferase [Oscillospiraceae bacterium]